mmetsp:Transcript_83255/g.147092  ORF Transcript_83255/g.147092 Transcript_83255/m.147092 type:complete len:596 (+) Transcript_83255:104-1891(+)
MSAVLKLSYKGEMRRVVMKKDDSVSYENVCGSIAEAWPEVKDLTAKYVDEEGDLCVFCAASFTDFLSVSKAKASEKATGQLLLRLEFVAEAMPSGGKTPTCSDTAMSSNTSVTGEQEQVPLFQNWYTQQSCDPYAHGHGWDHWHHMAMAGIHGHGWDHGVDTWDGEHGHHPHHHWHWGHKKHEHGHHGRMGWDGKHGHGHGKWGTHKFQGQEWLLKPKKMLWLLTQLHASEALSSPAAVSLWVYLVPQAVKVLASDPEEAGRKLRKKLSDIKNVLQNFMAAAKQIEGLEQCETILMQLISSDDSIDPNANANAGELLVSLLTAVDALAFEKQVEFFQVFYELQKDRLHDLLDCWKSWCCGLPLDHHGVECKACGMHPLMGLRFKSTTSEDFDLCSECFCKKHNLPQRDDEFKLIPVDWANMWWKKGDSMKQESWGECKQAWKAWMKGKGKGKDKGGWEGWDADHTGKGKGKGWDADHKGKGKGKGWDADHKGKGKGKFKGKRSSWEAELEQQDCTSKCMRPGTAEAIPIVLATPIVADEMPSAPPMELLGGNDEEETAQKAHTLEEMGFGEASEMIEVLKSCGGDLSKALEKLTI